MGLLDEALAAQEAGPRRGTPCTVGVMLTDYPDEAADIEKAIWLRGPEGWQISASVLANVLKSKGIEVGHGAISRHRRKDCKCPS